MSYERARMYLIGFVALAGFVMMVLSFAPWLHFESAVTPRDGVGISLDLPGSETSLSRDIDVVGRTTIQEEDGWCTCRVGFGDGYIAAILGGLVALGAVGMLATRRDQLLAPLVMVLAAGVLFLAGWNAIADWQAYVWTQRAATEAADGETTVWLWMLVGLAAVTAVVSRVVWTMAGHFAEEAYDYDDDDEYVEGDEVMGEDGVRTTV